MPESGLSSSSSTVRILVPADVCRHSQRQLLGLSNMQDAPAGNLVTCLIAH
jgi:hypothetical protein